MIGDAMIYESSEQISCSKCKCRFGLFLCGPWWASGGLVVQAGVDDQVAEDLAGGGIHDGDVAELFKEQLKAYTKMIFTLL